MTWKYSAFSVFCVGFLLLQKKISASEKWTVTTSTGHLVATVGGKAELSCQLSPSQSAEHLEVQWFRGNSSNTVHLYRGGHEVNEKVAPEYVNRTEFVKAAIGKGKVTLRLHNISVSDDGPYYCSFKDDHFSDVASINLSVAALGLKTDIYILESFFKILIECNSGGWFPEPHMEGRNSKGEIIPHLSKSFSQDKARLFHMKMTFSFTKYSLDNVTCYIFNPLIGKGRQTNVTLTEVFAGYQYAMIFSLSLLLIVLLLVVISFYQLKNKKEIKFPCLKRTLSITCQSLCYIILGAGSLIYMQYRSKDVGEVWDLHQLLVGMSLVSVCRKKVSISDPLFLVYNNWILDILNSIFILMVLYPVILFILYWIVKK